MDTTLIIPDLHNRIFIAEAIIDKVNPTNVVFLGDYFDSFFDGIEVAQQTALWLKDSLKKKNRIHLLGNHDLSYITNNNKYRSSGFSWNKRAIIKKVGVDLGKLKHYWWVGDWLCTHAGLSNDFYQKYSKGLTVNNFLHKCIKNNALTTMLYACGASRGGFDKYSGIMWCDYDEFVDIPNIKQIFGHTAGKLRKTKDHICLDTWNQYYALHSNGKMIVKKFEDN